MPNSTLLRIVVLALFAGLTPGWSQALLTGLGTKYTQNFDSLASSGTTNTSLPTGWLIFEGAGATSTGTRVNQQYAADDGGSNTGDVYSYGATSADRGYGTLRSGSIGPFIGAQFRNDTGSTITSLEISYKGEQWRLGANNRTGGSTRDALQFQYSTTATVFNGATAGWTSFSTLDFNAVLDGVTASGSAGSRNGNLDANRTTITGTITGLSLAPGATFYIRWVDFDVTGADDGLAIDDFELTPRGSTGPVVPTLSISGASISEGDSGTKTLDFNVTLTSAATSAVTFSASTTNGSATAPSDFVALSGAPFSIGIGSSSTVVSVTINGDTDVEPEEQFTVTLSSLSGASAGTLVATGTIQNDDVATTPIWTIQGTGAVSTLAGVVTTRGIVTGITSNGFFIQTPPAESDGNPQTSDGLFIFTGTGAKPTSTGRLVRVTGTVTEFSSDGVGATLTELASSPTFVDLGAAPVPDPVDLPAQAFDPAQPLLDAPSKLEFMERFEGMRVRTPAMRSVSATATNGVFYAVPSTYAGLPFREAGVERTTRYEANLLPLVMPAGAPRFDMNPEVLGIDTNGLNGVSIAVVGFGSSVPAVVGPLTYTSRGFMLFPESGQVTAQPPTTAATPVRAPGACEFTVASMNLERYGETSGSTYTNLINKIASGVINRLRLPDVIALQESTSLSNLHDLAARILVLSGVQYESLLIPTSNDIIHNGILYKSSRVTKIGTEQLRFVADILPADGTDLFDRPPLVVELKVDVAGCGSKTFTVVGNHLKSLIGLDDAGNAGVRDRQKRRLEAERVADLMQELDTKSALTLGDFNAFEVNDAYVDVMATIMGTPTPATQVLDASTDIWSHTLQNLTYLLPASRRYTYVFNGDHQVLDHVLVNNQMFANLTGYEVLHNNADWPGSFKNNTTVGERYSDHDNPIAYFVVPTPALVSGQLRFSGFRLNPNNTVGTTGTFVNTTGAPITGPLYLVLENLPAGKTVVNSTGQYQGKPHVKVFDGASLAPGASATFPVNFANTPGGINFTPKVYSAKF